MTQPASSAGFLAPDLSVKVGQLLSMAQSMGIDTSITVGGRKINLLIPGPADPGPIDPYSELPPVLQPVADWHTGRGLGNPWALYDAANKWTDIANSILQSRKDLNQGANWALGRQGGENDISTSGGPSYDVWQGESAQNFASYIGNNLDAALHGLEDHARTVSKGMNEAANSCFVLWAAMAAFVASVVSLGTATTAGAIVAGIVTIGSGLTSSISGHVNDFQNAQQDIRAGWNAPPTGVAPDGRVLGPNDLFAPAIP